ncbi:hypothetical protein BGW36DRAFT_366945 [Talaromyces proteolyticus]|uniref:Uncharacterized protein n=1 Tax=Talaromyces proteolyticus TaxID=1131652 RepID=A0AAD4L067_9EURO|nr:uncharacterized protein BGW36DRAFT_366945 [Talaromyces proteolyticus]KAH8705138.1 hypothetical protein BGW36DRAFT_366945 [Talaromyces proteolyticus]
MALLLKGARIYRRYNAARSKMDFFAGCYCLRLRSAEYFSSTMRKGHRGKLSPTLKRGEIVSTFLMG